MRIGGRARPFVVVLRVVATSVGILGSIMMLVGFSIGAPATVSATSSSRTRVGWWILRSCELVRVSAVGVVLVPKAKLTVGALAFVTVPEGDSLVLNRPVPVRIAHCTFDFVWCGVVDQPGWCRAVEAAKLVGELGLVCTWGRVRKE